MDDTPTVTRDIDVELGEEELWELIGDGEAWAEWMTDASDVDVVPGGEGEVVDDGERRRVHVDDVVPGRRVSYRWWPAEEPAAVSTVELLIVPRPAGSTLRVTESLRASAAASMALDLRWAVRAWSLSCHRAALVSA